MQNILLTFPTLLTLFFTVHLVIISMVDNPLTDSAVSKKRQTIPNLTHHFDLHHILGMPFLSTLIIVTNYHIKMSLILLILNIT